MKKGHKHINPNRRNKYNCISITDAEIIATLYLDEEQQIVVESGQFTVDLTQINKFYDRLDKRGEVLRERGN